MNAQEIAALREENARLKQDNKRLADELEYIKKHVAWLQRQIYGQKSERFISDDAQTELALGVQPQEPDVSTETITYNRKKKTKPAPHGRDPIPSHLPRKKVEIEPDFDISDKKFVGNKITEKLEYKPPEFYVTQYIMPVYANKDNDDRMFNTALPPQVIEKGKAGASLVAQTIVTKCVDHMPLYRFSQQIKRDCDMHIAESTLNDWFAHGCFWLDALRDQLKQKIVNSDYLQIDESTIRVMIKSVKGKTHLGYMWVYYSPIHKTVVFDYSPTRKKDIPLKFVGDSFRGVIQTDGYEGYKKLCSLDGIVRAGCMAHGRRYFEYALTNDKPRSEWMLGKVKELFRIEREAHENAFSFDQRLKLRQETAASIISDMDIWLKENYPLVKPKSRIGKAIAYMLNRWDDLTVFLKDGKVEISNNLIENSIRPLALGRKNWLFAGSEKGAQRLATAYSILATCKLHGVNPFEYLTDVLNKIPGRKSTDIEDLLPMNW